ncbi:hypothetical protein AB1N83_011751 [Pleurotus pulmonarius]
MFFKSQAEWFRYSHHMAPPTSMPVAMSIERSKLPTQSTLVFSNEPTGGLNQSHASSLSPVVARTRRPGPKQKDSSLAVPLEPAITPAFTMRRPQGAYMHPNAPRGPGNYQVPDFSYGRQDQPFRAAASLPSSGDLDYISSPSPHAYFANTFTPLQAPQTVQSLPISGPSGSEPTLAPHDPIPHSGGYQQSQMPPSGPSDSSAMHLTNVVHARKVAQHLSDRYAARIVAPTPLRIPIQNQGTLLAAAFTPPSLPGSSPCPSSSDLAYPEEATHNGSQHADEGHPSFNMSDPDFLDARRTSIDISSSHFRPLTPGTMDALMDPVLMSWSS